MAPELASPETGLRTEKRRNAFPNLGASREAVSGRKLSAFFRPNDLFSALFSIHLPCGEARRMRSISMTHFFVSHCRGALRCVALASCLVHGGYALAQTSVPPLFVTASRSGQPLTDLLADVTLIGPEEIARAGPGGLTGLLQRQPGIEVVTNGGPGSASGVFMRGANTAQTLVLVDGLRVSSSTTGTTPLEAIPLDQIDHIEILRGPASSLYGADAIGGVIQIFTRRRGGAFAANAGAGYGT